MSTPLVRGSPALCAAIASTVVVMAELTFDNAPWYEVGGVRYIDERAFEQLLGPVLEDNAELLARLGDR